MTAVVVQRVFIVVGLATLFFPWSMVSIFSLHGVRLDGEFTLTRSALQMLWGGRYEATFEGMSLTDYLVKKALSGESKRQVDQLLDVSDRVARHINTKMEVGWLFVCMYAVVLLLSLLLSFVVRFPAYRLAWLGFLSLVAIAVALMFAMYRPELLDSESGLVHGSEFTTWFLTALAAVLGVRLAVDAEHLARGVAADTCTR